MALKAGYNVSNFMCTIDNGEPGYLSSFTAPTLETEKISQALGPGGETKQMHGNVKFGDPKLVVNMADAGPMWTVMESVLNKSCTEFQMAVILADQNYKAKRRIDMAGCLVKELSFPKLDAKDGKKHMEMTVTAVCEGATYAAGDNNVIKAALSKKAKNWLVSNFEPSGMPGGIDPLGVTAITLPKSVAKIAEEHTGMMRLSTKHYAAWEVSGLTTEHSSHNYLPVQDLCVKVLQNGIIEDHEFEDWAVFVKDQTMAKELASFTFEATAPSKFTWAPELKGGADGMAILTVEWMLEGCRLKRTWV